ncbi:hypothetical protein ACFFIY_04875 [Bhargavaea ullalensis]|uniref:ElaB/YqjD/DUF883 family membrane-anchored ribosome-binding protein n=1 Tax=Bhargavaea ullalensis TaxID=1265685 RepID=A0ABV2G9Q7_9BACL
MMKTVKGKLVAGAITVALVSSAGGVVFGASDAGGKLRQWYDKQFNTASTELASGVAAHGKKAAEDAWDEYSTLKDGAGSDILAQGTATGNAANANIEANADEHIDSLKIEYGKLFGKVEGQFDGIEQLTKLAIKAAGDEAKRQAFNDLNGYTSEKGKKAIADLTTLLETTTNSKAEELAETIRNTKQGLIDEIAKNKDATEAELNTAIDNKVNELRTLVTTEKDRLVTAQKTAIQNAAAGLEADAKKKMQDLVDGI